MPVIFSDAERFEKPPKKEPIRGDEGFYAPPSVLLECRKGPKMVANWVRVEDKRSEPTPGPGAYNIPRNTDVRRGKGAPMVPRRLIGGFVHQSVANATPGPASYFANEQGLIQKSYNAKQFKPRLPPKSKPVTTRPREFRMHDTHAVGQAAGEGEVVISADYRPASNAQTHENSHGGASAYGTAITQLLAAAAADGGAAAAAAAAALTSNRNSSNGNPAKTNALIDDFEASVGVLDLSLPYYPAGTGAAGAGAGAVRSGHGQQSHSVVPSSPAYMNMTHKPENRGQHNSRVSGSANYSGRGGTSHRGASLVKDVAQSLLTIASAQPPAVVPLRDHLPLAFKSIEDRDIADILFSRSPPVRGGRRITYSSYDNDGGLSSTGGLHSPRSPTTVVSSSSPRSAAEGSGVANSPRTGSAGVGSTRRNARPASAAARVESRTTVSREQAARSPQQQMLQINTALADLRLLAMARAVDAPPHSKTALTPSRKASTIREQGNHNALTADHTAAAAAELFPSPDAAGGRAVLTPEVPTEFFGQHAQIRGIQPTDWGWAPADAKRSAGIGYDNAGDLPSQPNASDSGVSAAIIPVDMMSFSPIHRRVAVAVAAAHSDIHTGAPVDVDHSALSLAEIEKLPDQDAPSPSSDTSPPSPTSLSRKSSLSQSGSGEFPKDNQGGYARRNVIAHGSAAGAGSQKAGSQLPAAPLVLSPAKIALLRAKKLVKSRLQTKAAAAAAAAAAQETAGRGAGGSFRRNHISASHPNENSVPFSATPYAYDMQSGEVYNSFTLESRGRVVVESSEFSPFKQDAKNSSKRHLANLLRRRLQNSNAISAFPQSPTLEKADVHLLRPSSGSGKSSDRNYQQNPSASARSPAEKASMSPSTSPSPRARAAAARARSKLKEVDQPGQLGQPTAVPTMSVGDSKINNPLTSPSSPSPRERAAAARARSKLKEVNQYSNLNQPAAVSAVPTASVVDFKINQPTSPSSPSPRERAAAARARSKLKEVNQSGQSEQPPVASAVSGADSNMRPAGGSGSGKEGKHPSKPTGAHGSPSKIAAAKLRSKLKTQSVPADATADILFR